MITSYNTKFKSQFTKLRNSRVDLRTLHESANSNWGKKLTGIGRGLLFWWFIPIDTSTPSTDNSTKFCFLRGNCGKQLVKFDYHAILLGGMRELAALYSHFTLKLKFICTHTNLSSLESEKNQEQEDKQIVLLNIRIIIVFIWK